MFKYFQFIRYPFYSLIATSWLLIITRQVNALGFYPLNQEDTSLGCGITVVNDKEDVVLDESGDVYTDGEYTESARKIDLLYKEYYTVNVDRNVYNPNRLKKVFDSQDKSIFVSENGNYFIILKTRIVDEYYENTVSKGTLTIESKSGVKKTISVTVYTGC